MLSAHSKYAGYQSASLFGSRKSSHFIIIIIIIIIIILCFKHIFWLTASNKFPFYSYYRYLGYDFTRSVNAFFSTPVRYKTFLPPPLSGILR